MKKEVNDNKKSGAKDGGFDMYHFFSRWDVLLFAGFILLLLIVAVVKIFFSPQAA